MASPITNGSAAAFEVSPDLKRQPLLGGEQPLKNAIAKSKHWAAMVLTYIATTAAAITTKKSAACSSLPTAATAATAAPTTAVREPSLSTTLKPWSLARRLSRFLGRLRVCRQEWEDNLQVKCDEEMKKRTEKWKGEMKGWKEDFDKEKQEVENDEAKLRCSRIVF